MPTPTPLANPSYHCADSLLGCDERTLLSGLDPRLRLGEPMSCGAILEFHGEASARHRIILGSITGMTGFTALARTSPFWMVPSYGYATEQVPCETQWMLAQLADGSCLMLAPLVSGRRRWTLELEHGQLSLNGSANDSQVIDSSGAALFVAHGRDPYALMPLASSALAQRMGYRLRTHKPRPALTETLGWCTFNAFYADISQEKIRSALSSLQASGIPVRWLLIDGGWQSAIRAAGGESWLAAITADAVKFPGGLAATIRMAKQDFGLSDVMVWHAIAGLPGGIADGAVAGMAVVTKERRQTAGIYVRQPTIDDWFGLRVSTPLARDAPLLFAALHSYLKAEGADAIKVDFQSTLEGVCQGEGGRVDYDRAWRTALEDSSSRFFDDGLINCMSCSSEGLYLGEGSSLVRTSDDYMPNKPDSHGLHLHTNAQMGMWFGEFIQPDWDMFQSRHPFGGFHAAGRALSGGPILITDEVGAHDPAVIRRLVLANGRALMGDHPGRPSPDSLFADPTRQSRVLKIFNRSGAAGMVGMFHANHSQHLPLETDLSSRDVPGMEESEVVAFLHHSERTVRLEPGQSLPVRLAHGGHEMAVLAPVHDGLAMLGLGDRYCAPAAMHEIDDRQGIYRARCHGDGPIMAWSARAPRRVEIDGTAVSWQWHADTGIGSCNLPPGSHRIEIHR